MNPKKFRQFLALAVGLLLAAHLAFAEDTNATATILREEMTQNYLRLQQQLQTMQLEVEQNQAEMATTTRTNADALAAQFQLLEKSLAAQRTDEAEAARKTQQWTFFMAGAFGVAGLGIMLMMVFFQWRAFAQLAQISSRQPAIFADVKDGVHQLASPGRAQVESSNARLLDVVGQLEKRIQELEGGQGFLPGTTMGANKPVDLLAEAQRFLDLNRPEAALDVLEKFLAEDPANANALIKKAIALEKLGRLEEALTFCDQAIAMDRGLALAHLHKGGLLNRLRRYDEALDCYESALQAQDKKPASVAK